MHEVLFAPDEQPEISEHPLISAVDVPAMSPELAAELDPYRPDEVVDLRPSRSPVRRSSNLT
jgi:hypothetical protein